MAFIKRIGSQIELDTLLEDKKNGLVIIDFYALGCASCHSMAAFYEKLSNIHRNVAFAKVDVDDLQSVAHKYNVTSTPTFMFIKNKVIVDQVTQANSQFLESVLKKHAPSHPSPSDSSSVSEPATGDISLLEFLDVSQLNCLNESTNHSIKSILQSKSRNTSGSHLLSDADEQLLLNITFNQSVRVRSIVLQTSDSSLGPKKIKLLTNRPSLGFEDVEDQEEPVVAQVLQVSDDVIREGKHILLRFVRFQTVNSLHIFVASNQGGGDETRIDAVDVFGVPVQTTKSLSGLKRQDD